MDHFEGVHIYCRPDVDLILFDFSLVSSIAIVEW